MAPAGHRALEFMKHQSILRDVVCSSDPYGRISVRPYRMQEGSWGAKLGNWGDLNCHNDTL